MAAKTTPPSATRSSPPPGRPAWIAPTFTVLALVIVVVALTQLLGRDDKSSSAASYSALNAALGSAVPLLAAAAIAFLMPAKHGWRVRFPLAVMSALFALFKLQMRKPTFSNELPTTVKGT